MSGAAETEPIRRRLETRLGELRAELDRGRRMLAELEARGELLRDSVTRIAGAVQVLEEMVGEGGGEVGEEEDRDAPPAG